MPIVDIELVATRHEAIAPDLARRIADELGHVFRSGPGHTWVRVHELPIDRYAENDVATPPQPVFVTVLQAVLPDGTARSAQAQEIAAATARATGRPIDTVHVVFDPPASGRVAFGGKLRS
jgi:phenylpyruvate tautomerase PptA (4-oxalocrotonate tautomerase family)